MIGSVKNCNNKDFKIIYSIVKRIIVFHECFTFNDAIKRILKPYDLLFFDDCVYSQYVFLKKYNIFFKDNNIFCILGFSSGLIRKPNAIPIKEIETKNIHDRVNDIIKSWKDIDKLPYECNGMMSIDELNEMNKEPNIFIALHGCVHLHLHELDLLEKIKAFEADVKNGKRILEEYGFRTNIYVYPYAYSFLFSEKILKKYKFIYSFAGEKTKRIPIEKLIANEN